MTRLGIATLLILAGTGAIFGGPLARNDGTPEVAKPDDGIDKNILNDIIELTIDGVEDQEVKYKKMKPFIRHPGTFDDNYDRKKIVKNVNSWSPDDGTNIWELSGLREGDIMTSSLDYQRHGVLNESLRWQYGIVPYHIQEDDFSEEELKTINDALDDLRKNTCIHFRPMKKSDADYIVVQGTESGCWSFVGKQGEGQVLNLMTPGCVKHGVVIHEFVHALGFYHQQSSYDRDKYVTIHWDNIVEEHKHNFKKYDSDTVSNYEAGYDYSSLMHYGPRAFAKSKGLVTITPKAENVTIGQRHGLSKKDVVKLKKMYEGECKSRDLLENIVDWSFQVD